MVESNPTAQRSTTGRPFPKGVSGNPGGRPKVLTEVLAKHREHVDELLDELFKIATKNKSARVRVAATKEFLDRVIGKPAQAIELTGAGGGPVQAHVEAEVTDVSLGATPEERTAAILGVLRRVGAIPASGGAGGAGAPHDAAAEPVHQAGPDAAPGSVPPAEPA